MISSTPATALIRTNKKTEMRCIHNCSPLDSRAVAWPAGFPGEGLTPAGTGSSSLVLLELLRGVGSIILCLGDPRRSKCFRSSPNPMVQEHDGLAQPTNPSPHRGHEKHNPSGYFTT